MTSAQKGQAALESTVALVLGLMLILATAKVFFWLGARLVARQIYYECSRGPAGRQRPADARFGSPIWGGEPINVGANAGNYDANGDGTPNNPGNPQGFAAGNHKKEQCRPPDAMPPLRIFGSS